METKKSYFGSFISGAIAGSCSKTIIAPIERIKIIFQTRSREFTYKECIEEFKYVYRKNGVWDFWRGNSANLLRVAPMAAINFSTFDLLRKWYAGDANDRSWGRSIRLFLCGCVSSTIAVSVTYPLDFLRTRLAMQRENYSYSNLFHAVTKIYHQEGLRSFYSGVGISFIGVAMYHGIGFYQFTLQKERIMILNPKLQDSKIVDFLLGGLGAVLAQIISYPFEITKKRLQGQRCLLQIGEVKEMMGLRQMIKQIYREGMFRGFYKGVSLNLIKGPISSGTTWTVKNAINRKLDTDYDL